MTKESNVIFESWMETFIGRLLVYSQNKKFDLSFLKASMSEVTSKWKEEELHSESVSKKQIAEFLQSNASSEFLVPRKLAGKLDV